MKQNLGVRVIGLKDAACCLQFLPEFRVIVDFAVKNNVQGFVRCGHGLGPALQIQNREPPVTKMNPPRRIHKKTLSIGPAVHEKPRHLPQVLG
jgi:hypothetical protein